MIKKKFLVISILLVAIFLWVWQKNKPAVISLDLPPAQNINDFSQAEIEDSQIFEEQSENVELEQNLPEQEIIKEEKLISPQINLAVPFTSQAPLSDWSQPWQDACEEASFLMLDYYYQNKKLPLPAVVSDVLKEMVDWQISNWGDHHNLTITELKDYIEANFAYRVEIIEDLDLAKIKNILNDGKPLIVPADGHLLANPYFSGNGPDYHMLVIKGYQDNYLISNDPGTRYGADFIYQADHLLASIFDWNQKELRASGPKRGLIISPN
ncbi:C39 family peptidase [Candidatus Nomurabacteria bacterium]|nr:C39 family peptidase [Candidatus Nomurabacteria bacterium]